MTNQPRRPSYPNRPIRNVATLSAALRVPSHELRRIADIANTQYRNAKPIRKPDGTERQPIDALPLLKGVQQRIKTELFYPIEFPEYLTGSIRGRSARVNAELHAGAAIVVCEDIQKFFPSTKAPLVHSIWMGFFGFSTEVSELLTALTTKDGALPEGAVTSSYLANLAFWDREPELHHRFQEQGISYSRYVDDITISSAQPLTSEQLGRSISMIYGMIRSRGFMPKRSKHEVHRADRQMRATKLVVNRRASLPDTERKAIRTAVAQLERRWNEFGEASNLSRDINSVSGRVTYLAQMHPGEGEKLKQRIARLREASKQRAMALATS